MSRRYDPRKAIKLAAKNAIGVFTLGGQAYLFDSKTGRQISDLHVIRYLYDHPMDWVGYLVAPSETSQGDRYAPIWQVIPETSPTFQTDLMDSLGEAWIDFISECKKIDMVNIGWVLVADGTNKILDEKQIGKLISRLPQTWTTYQRGFYLQEKEKSSVDVELEKYLRKVT